MSCFWGLCLVASCLSWCSWDSSLLHRRGSYMRLMLLFCWKERPDVCLDVGVICVCTIKLYRMFILTLTFSFMPEPKVEASVLKVPSEKRCGSCRLKNWLPWASTPFLTLCLLSKDSTFLLILHLYFPRFFHFGGREIPHLEIFARINFHQINYRIVIFRQRADACACVTLQLFNFETFSGFKFLLPSTIDESCLVTKNFRGLRLRMMDHVKRTRQEWCWSVTWDISVYIFLCLCKHTHIHALLPTGSLCPLPCHEQGQADEEVPHCPCLSPGPTLHDQGPLPGILPVCELCNVESFI